MKNFLLVSFFIALFLLTVIFIFYDVICDYFIGATARRIIKVKLKRFARNYDYLLLSKVRLLMQNGDVLKIDHILFADRYIYVLKCKIWLGDLTGIVIDESWMLYHNGEKTHVYNPIKQNEFTIDFLAKLLQAERDDFYNLAVFPTTVYLDNIKPDRGQAILPVTELIKFIKNNEKNKDVAKFTVASIEQAANTILNYHIKTEREL